LFEEAAADVLPKISSERTRRRAFGAGVDVDLESDSGELVNFELRGLEGLGRGVHAREDGRNIEVLGSPLQGSRVGNNVPFVLCETNTSSEEAPLRYSYA